MGLSVGLAGFSFLEVIEIFVIMATFLFVFNFVISRFRV